MDCLKKEVQTDCHIPSKSVPKNATTRENVISRTADLTSSSQPRGHFELSSPPRSQQTSRTEQVRSVLTNAPNLLIQNPVLLLLQLLSHYHNCRGGQSPDTKCLARVFYPHADRLTAEVGPCAWPELKNVFIVPLNWYSYPSVRT